MAEYPVGKAQSMVLKALGKSAATFVEAERIFEELGLVVTSKRQGRETVPVVTVKDRLGGGMTEYGEGETYEAYPEFDTTPIAQWIVR